MRELKINKKVIAERIDIIQKSLEKLEELKKMSAYQFIKDENNFAIAEHYLRYALEAIFDICAHILSRIPGVKVDEYKQIALEIGKQGLLPKKFSENNLYKMAGYRNRLTHFYLEIAPEEIYQILQNNLDDFKFFIKNIKKLLIK